MVKSIIYIVFYFFREDLNLKIKRISLFKLDRVGFLVHTSILRWINSSFRFK